MIFVIEGIMKMLAFGVLFNGPDSYLRTYWNWIDLPIIIFSVLSISLPQINLKVLKILRMFRILRPLKFISKN